MSDGNFLYEDDYVAVSKDKVKIKTYFFPTARAKTVSISDLKGVYWERQKFDWTVSKGWGMSLTPCWWACDLSRKLRSNDTQMVNVVLDNGEQTFKGFSCTNVFAFLDVLRPLMAKTVVVQDSLPFQ